jgi:hypothetical protein
MATAEATLIHGTQQAGEHRYRLGEFDSYHEAEGTVGRLCDDGFPIERVRIAGIGPHSAEQVMGRLRTARAVLLGAGLGAWLGVLTGLVLALSVAGPAWLSVLMGGLLAGAFAGGLVGFLTHWATDGRRDFHGTGLRAQRYTVEVDWVHAAEAYRVLNRTWLNPMVDTVPRRTRC